MLSLKWIANTPIFRRLFLAFLMAAIIPGAVITLLAAKYIDTLNTLSKTITISNDATLLVASNLATLQTMNANLTALHADTYASMDNGMTDMGKQLKSDITNMQYSFSQATTLYQNKYTFDKPDMAGISAIITANSPSLITDQARTLASLFGSGAEWQNYLNAQNKELQALQVGMPHDQAHMLLDDANAKFSLLLHNWKHLLFISQTTGGLVANQGASQTSFIELGTVVSILGMVMVVVAVGYIVNLTITRPLRHLAELTRRIGKGDTSARAFISSRDEIAMVATSMNNMLNNIVRLIQEAQAQRDALQSQVEKLVSEVSGVGEGDLRVQAEVTADALGVLADSFNYMVEELGSLVVRVKMVAHEVENSTTVIFDSLTQLVETGDAQLNQIAGASVEVEQMAQAGFRMAERAQVLQNLARDARLSAQGGRDAVQQAVMGMNRIHDNVQTTASKVQNLGERSREINNIVEAISSIAHQTNRLALDAAIQAAMAGENGKGFGAVAADIRRLAERSKDEASSIARIVRGVREEIGAVAVSMQDTERETSGGTKLTQQAGVSLESIFTAVEHQAREIETVNQMAAQQVQSSNAVVQIMRGVSTSTQRSNMAMRESSHNMERLALLVEQLRASVEAFKLRSNDAYFIPPSNISITPEADPQLPVTVNGSRTITANALSPVRDSNPMPFYPLSPNWQDPSWDQSFPVVPQSRPYSPGQPYPAYPASNEQVGNASANRSR